MYYTTCIFRIFVVEICNNINFIQDMQKYVFYLKYVNKTLLFISIWDDLCTILTKEVIKN